MCKPSDHFELISTHSSTNHSIIPITTDRSFIKSSCKFFDFRTRKIIKTGQLVQSSGSNITYITRMNGNRPVIVSLYSSNSTICFRLEGIFTKKLYNSFYLQSEAGDQIPILSDTLHANDYFLL